MEMILETANAIVWGVPVLLLILAVGIGLSLRTKFAQIRFLPQAFRTFFQSLKRDNRCKDGISGYKALCTALAATVGTGNIAGVAGAIAIGGPGVIFWMWVCALLGMITKFAEVTLAVHYRVKDAGGQFIGGPMYIIANGLPKKFHFLSYVYCFMGVIAAFGVGNATQVNAVIGGVKDIANLAHCGFNQRDALMIGAIIAVLVVIVFCNGSGRISNWAEKLVPLASVIYMLLALGVLFLCRSKLPGVMKMIITSAFTPEAATGGIVTSFFITLRVGTSRGVFTNEAGMGTASIAHASADVQDPVRQGLMGIIEVFLDTILICTLTAFVILCSGVPIPYGSDPGIILTMDAFSRIYGNASKFIITVLACIFAFATILGWGLYGARCAQYLFGERAWYVFVIAQAGCILLSATLETSVVWLFAEIVNGLMAIPNLIALVLLSPVFVSILKNYTHKEEAYRLQ